MAGRKKTETVEAEVVETAVVPAGKMEFRLINPTEDGFLRRIQWNKEELEAAVRAKTYRLGRLCYMLAQNRDFVDTLLDNIEQEKVTKMRTAMLTRYPENKEVRGIMKLVNRVEDKKNGYKLTYEAELVEGRTEQQTLQEWLRRENEWQKNRAKASSKSKDAK